MPGIARLKPSRDIVALSGIDRTLSGVQRQFVYLPFEHAEDLPTQREGLRLFAQLELDVPALVGLLTWAQRHHDIIERFGRFPHRNAVLGRPSTPEELEFLQPPGSLRRRRPPFPAGFFTYLSDS